jgi:ABC-type transport system involved in multi-copper enzyme maturation permease subunit
LLGPIFAREWLTVPRQPRHYVMRCAYLGLLWVLGLTAWQATIGWDRTATLGDTARFGIRLFQILTYVQLTLVLFFSALSAASTIAREKDRRTFVLLLMTDLRNYEIVLGKLFGSLLPIALLLLGMLPLLGLNLLLGGVAPDQLVQASLIMAGTAVAAGSLGGLVALWREKTFQALALTVLFLVLYECVIQAVGVAPAMLAYWFPTSAGYLSSDGIVRVQAALDPFRALLSVLERSSGEGLEIAAAYAFAGTMVLLSVLLNVWAVLRLRVWNPSGEPVMQRERPGDEVEEIDRARAHSAPGPVRAVWANPILWREIRTRAYGRRPALIKAAYAVVLGLICYYALGHLLYSSFVAGSEFVVPAQDRYAATVGLVAIGVLSLLLATAQAATAITSERDTGALDLLLVTDLTPKEFIFGKLWGVCYNTKEYLLPPLIVAGICAAYGVLAIVPRGHPELVVPRNIETCVYIILGMLILLAFAAVLGVHVALRTANSQLAIINSLGTIFFLSAGTAVCIALISINPRFESQWTSFILFLFAGIGGLWWVLNGDRPSGALTLASWFCPPAVFYAVTAVLVGKPGTEESGDPLLPFVVVAFAFSFTIAAMLVPLLSEFDVALGRVAAAQE